MKITLTRKNEKFHFQAKNESGKLVDLDSSPEMSGINAGFRPMEMVATSLAGCASIDLLNILYKQRQKITDYRVEISATRIKELPNTFEQIHLKFILEGEIDLAKVESGIQKTFDKYCSVYKILEPTCEITHEIEIVNR
jgi:putative redox protein